MNSRDVGIITFELAVWGDASIRLYHEDAINGDDIVIVLGQHGVSIVVDSDGEIEHLEAIPDLVTYLRTLATSVDNEASQ